MGSLFYCTTVVCHYATQTNEMHTFQINTFIQFFQFLTSSTCFEPHGFIFRKTAVNAVCAHTNACKTHHTKTVYSCLPENEPTRFEPCRRHQKLKKWIKVLIWKVRISLVCVAQLYQNARCKNIKFVVSHFPPEVSGAQVCSRLRGLR